jgi:hypothetical protein
VATGVVDPLALASMLGRLPVDLVTLRILDSAGLDDDSVTGCVGRNYAITDFTSIHSPQPR